ncbi:MAG: excinuclease ABC subunit UvrC [Propionibacteriaceae bacterium]
MAVPSSYRPAPGSIPEDPGVYRFSDAQGRVIYVGKAKSLRSRLNSYFADIGGLHNRTRTMVTSASKVEWTVVQTEVEALQLEYTWIKQYDPRFNVKYRDDKSYPWLCVTMSEEFPRVMVGRGAKRKGYRYFGPYSHAWAIRETMDLVLRVFPMRSCRPGVFKNHSQIGRPCLLGYIGKCAAPCVGRVDAAAHREIVEDFCEFMAGHATPLIKRLERDMHRASDEMDYERAARLRDDIGALNQAMEKNAIVFRDGTDADVIALAEDPLEVAVQIFHVRGGRVRGERGWVADRYDESGTPELVEQFLLQLYAESDDGVDDRDAVPREILVPALPQSIDSLTELLSERRGSAVSIRVPQRGDKRVLMETVSRNAGQTLIRHKATRSGDLSTRNQALEEIQEALELPSAPLRMECFDISNLQGTEVVASMVVFEDGLPRKSEYRRFVIRNVEGQNDVASMHEVITRRFRRLMDDRAALHASDDAEHHGSGTNGNGTNGNGTNGTGTNGHGANGTAAEGPLLIDPTTGAPRRFAYTPALVVVDGGPPQVAAAARALEELGITDVALCGLAKRLEEVWLPDNDEPVILPRTSEGLYLLQRLRDEAHRFAITHHRSRRSKTMVESLLDQVPGLGEVRRKALMTHFGSLKKLRAATVEEIASVPGFGTKTAQSIKALLETSPQRESVNTATGEILE